MISLSKRQNNLTPTRIRPVLKDYIFLHKLPSQIPSEGRFRTIETESRIEAPPAAAAVEYVLFMPQDVDVVVAVGVTVLGGSSDKAVPLLKLMPFLKFLLVNDRK